MDCLGCQSKACKIKAQDCNGHKDLLIELYKDENYQNLYLQADKLVAGGRVGSLSRAEEIVEFARNMGYGHLALAYCFGIEALAGRFRDFLRQNDFEVSSFRCTINGIRENEILPQLPSSVNCNPLGQAEAINESTADFVIEMGLCLGHDVILHQRLKKPFTVFLVKDRVFGHNPGAFFEGDR